MLRRIIKSEMHPAGIWTTYADGTQQMLPYKINENGEEYFDMADVWEHNEKVGG